MTSPSEPVESREQPRPCQSVSLGGWSGDTRLPCMQDDGHEGWHRNAGITWPGSGYPYSPKPREGTAAEERLRDSVVPQVAQLRSDLAAALAEVSRLREQGEAAMRIIQHTVTWLDDLIDIFTSTGRVSIRVEALETARDALRAPRPAGEGE